MDIDFIKCLSNEALSFFSFFYEHSALVNVILKVIYVILLYFSTQIETVFLKKRRTRLKKRYGFLKKRREVRGKLSQKETKLI